MEEILKRIQELDKPFYYQIDFWINLVVGLASVVFSYIAYREAKQAKKAAYEAGKAVKIQTVTIELTELIQRLDKLDINISYQDARDFYSEINRKVRRIISPYRSENIFAESINAIFTSLDEIKTNLSSVRPYDRNLNDESTGNTVYYAVESEFSNLSGRLAEICGIFEQNNY